MFGPWVPENSPNVEELLPLGQAGGPQYEPEYTSVKEGYVRKSTKSMPLNHGIPFGNYLVIQCLKLPNLLKR